MANERSELALFMEFTGQREYLGIPAKLPKCRDMRLLLNTGVLTSNGWKSSFTKTGCDSAGQRLMSEIEDAFAGRTVRCAIGTFHPDARFSGIREALLSHVRPLAADPEVEPLRTGIIRAPLTGSHSGAKGPT